MILSRSETQQLFELVLSLETKSARSALNSKLKSIERTEPEFYMSVIQHSQDLNCSPEQWFNLLSKIPNRVFRDEIIIMNKLSESQRNALPPALFG